MKREGKLRKAKVKKSSPIVEDQSYQSQPLTADKRRELRTRQLVAAGRGKEDLQTPDTGNHSTIENPGSNPYPVIRGPQLGRNPRPLQGDPDLLHDDRERAAGLETIVAVSVENKQLQAFDNQLTNVFDAVQSLDRMLDGLRHAVSNEAEPLSKVEELADIMDSAVLPWLNQMDTVFNSLLDLTDEASGKGL